MQARLTTGGGGVHTTLGGLSAPYWIKLVRTGHTFTGYSSADGTNWVPVSDHTTVMARDIYVGLAVTAHNSSGPPCRSEFEHVSMGKGDGATRLARAGHFDGNTAENFVTAATPSKGTENPGLSRPFVEVSSAVPAPLGFGDIAGAVATDIADDMRGINSSMQCRLAFEVDEPEQFSGLNLRMKYDDGFVAYLNGVEVARDGFTGLPRWDSVADGDRADPLAGDWVSFDISNDVGTLIDGSNVLAIQGLSHGVSDDDFVIVAELVASSERRRAQYMVRPTPGQENIAGALGVVDDVDFSVQRGFYATPLDVRMSSRTQDAAVYYTTDFSEPHPDSATAMLYSEPISLTGTTVLRAVAFKPGWQSTDVDTHTYIFLDHVLDQPEPPGDPPDGYPTTWCDGYPADYGMVRSARRVRRDGKFRQAAGRSGRHDQPATDPGGSASASARRVSADAGGRTAV